MAEGVAPARRTLVPMDGSMDAANALAVALRIARASGGSLAALYVAKSGALTKRKRLPAQPLDEFAEHDAEEAEEARLALAPARVWSKTAGVPTELMGARGDAAREIAEAAAAMGAERIVMGTHGKSGASGGTLLGSVARAVFTTSAVPTVVVPSKAVHDPEALARDLARESEGLPIGPKIVAAFDGGPGSDEVVRESVQLAATTRGSVHLFSGLPEWPGGDAARAYDAAKEAARKAGVPVSTDRGAHEALEGLVRMANEGRADVIVVGTRAAPGHTPDRLGSFTDRLLAEVGCPVEVMRLAPTAARTLTR